MSAPKKPTWEQDRQHKGYMCSCWSTNSIRPKITPCAAKLYEIFNITQLQVQSKQQDTFRTDAEINKLNTQISELNSHLSQSKSKEDRLQQNVSVLQNDLQSQAKLYKERQLKFQNEYNELKSTTESTSQIIQDLQAEKGIMLDRLKDFEIKLSNSESEKLLLQTKIFELKSDSLTQTKSFEDAKVLFQNENGRLKSEHELVSQTILKLRAENDHVHVQNETLTRKFEKRVTDLQHELEVKTSVFNCQRSRLFSKVEHVDKENQALSDKCSQLQTTLLNLEAELHTKLSESKHHSKPNMVSKGIHVDIPESTELSKNRCFLDKLFDIVAVSSTFKCFKQQLLNKQTVISDNTNIQKQILLGWLVWVCYFKKLQSMSNPQPISSELPNPKLVSVATHVLIPEGNPTKVLSPKSSPHTAEKKVTSPQTPKIFKPKKSLSPRYNVSSGYYTTPSVVTTYGENGKITGFRDQYGWFPHKPKKPSKTSCVITDHVSETKSNPFSKHVSSKKWKPKREFSSRSTSYSPIKYSIPELLAFKPRPVNLAKPKSFDFPLRPQNLFFNDTPCIKPKWNAMSISQIDSTYKWYSKSFSI